MGGREFLRRKEIVGCSLETIIGYMCVAWVVYIRGDLHFCLLEEQPQKD